MSTPQRVAIDGPAASGKSTAARRVASDLQVPWIDTGAMYRSLALKALRQGADLDSERNLAEILETTSIEIEGGRVKLDGEEVGQQIRTAEVAAAASRVAVHERVRTWMVQRQRDMAGSGGVVMEGRDIGTVVLPHAEVKIFLTADAETREDRRTREAGERDPDLALRDSQDQSRRASPLVPADDAIIIDTTRFSIDQVVQMILDICRERASG